MTEFEKWWNQHQLSLDKALAEQVWNAAQRALIRTIREPPYIPKAGETIRFLGLCHPNSLGKPTEVTEVTEEVLKVYWVGTKRIVDGEPYFCCGILSEVEPVI